MYEDLLDRIDASQMILIGLGEEVDASRSIQKSLYYRQIENRTEKKQMMPYVMSNRLLDVQNDWKSFYQDLFSIVKEKNYFVVSTCMDGYAKEFFDDGSRVVMPCGQYQKLQCPEGCHSEFFDISETLKTQVYQYMKESIPEQMLEFPVCPYCGRSLVFNNVHAEKYLEDSYLKQWSVYIKWLQGTLNKELTVLELGVGMSFPTVIRWPFEKTVFLNQKAVMYRIHSRLYQVTEEIKDKAYGIQKDPVIFVKELSKKH